MTHQEDGKKARGKGKSRVSRKAFLRGAGAALVLVAAGGVWRATDQGVFGTGQGPAYEPWENWRETSGEGGPLSLVSSAILASNPHNSQPWLFRVGDSRIDLFADRRRNIGTVDPFLREMYLGIGCALENLLLTARTNGYEYDLTLTPDRSDPAHAARIELSPAEADTSPLYTAIPDRHTDRAAYDTERPVSQETLDELAGLGDDPDVETFWFTAPEERRRVGDLTVSATEDFVADGELARDSHEWFRHDWDELQRERDGVTLDATGLSDFMRIGSKMLPETSEEQSNQFWLAATRDRHVSTAAAFGMIAVRDGRNDAQRMRAGRLWQRMHLWATTEGLAMHPLNQINELSEREEVVGTEPVFGNAKRDLIGDPNWDGIFTFRTGYPTTEPLLSPRRAAEDVLA